MLDVVAGKHQLMYAVIVTVFAVAAMVAMASGSGLLRSVGGLVLVGCFSFGVMLWSSWNAPPEVAEAFDMIGDLDEQFAEVSAALAGVEANLAAPAGGPARPSAQAAVDRLVAAGHMLVGRQCEEMPFGMGREHLAYLSADDDPVLVRLTNEIVRGTRGALLNQSSSTGESPLLSIDSPCI